MNLSQEVENYSEYIDRIAKWAWELAPKILVAILIFFVGRYVIKFLNRLVRKFFERKDYDPALETFLQSFISIALKVVLAVLVVTQLGVQTSSLVAMIGAAGLAIGLALTRVIGQFCGGCFDSIVQTISCGRFYFGTGARWHCA